MAKVIFTYDGKETTIQCLKEDKIENICNEYASKINENINSLLFIYSGNQVNLELSFNQQAKQIDKERSIMNILVYKQEKKKFKCPKCGELINIDIFDNLLKLNSNQADMLKELKSLIEIINNSNEISTIKSKILDISLITNNLIEENEKNKNHIQNISNNIKDNNTKQINLQNNIDLKKNIIKGIFNVNNALEDVTIFNQYADDDGFDVYLNDEKINVIKSYKIQYTNFLKKGNVNYEFKIKFKDNFPNLERIFQNCSNVVSIDLTDFAPTNATSVGWMFNNCKKLKEIKGINKINTEKVYKMTAMFQNCNEMEYLDLSDFDTSNATEMGGMFMQCYKLKEIKGINKFNTSNVNSLKGTFQNCREMEYLDLSNFDTSKVIDMRWTFNGCFNLKEIKGINKFNTSNVNSLKGTFQNCSEMEYLDLSNFDTSNVIDMDSTFNGCFNLKEIKGINKFNTSKVNNMKAMFANCEEIEYLDLSNFDTSHVTDMSWMFFNCNKLKYLNLLRFSLDGCCDTKKMLNFSSKDNCEFITNNNALKQLYI